MINQLLFYYQGCCLAKTGQLLLNDSVEAYMLKCNVMLEQNIFVAI